MEDLGTYWYAVKKTGGYYKRPFASTTVADSDVLRVFAGKDYTWNEAKNNISYQSDEMSAVIQRFIDNGYGDHKMSEFIEPLG